MIYKYITCCIIVLEFQVKIWDLLFYFLDNLLIIFGLLQYLWIKEGNIKSRSRRIDRYFLCPSTRFYIKYREIDPRENLQLIIKFYSSPEILKDGIQYLFVTRKPTVHVQDETWGKSNSYMCNIPLPLLILLLGFNKLIDIEKNVCATNIAFSNFQDILFFLKLKTFFVEEQQKSTNKKETKTSKYGLWTATIYLTKPLPR